ncbi:hypothetical protein [Alloalcanivorax gelatiniphagus]|uniref:Uncharacterized protein n=1 Tax=Alloalcanivorax gelatiniphagus TaxID=1194167 RepID=A0ABY2XJ83_9GAMM|nr:hypothetical protein [Alloalcanivorax gelatiniphagus]TMW11962.1 hypothetical protein FGS76_13125 [Alloalcanivorax gelatiniphagus]
MTSFTVDGPHEIEWENRKGGRQLVFDNFWNDGSKASHLAAERGCYVFVIRSGGGLTPVYIGQASVSFKQETFNPSNRHKYQNGFSNYAKGTPLMYFVVHPNQQGVTNKTQITEIEDFLIQAGVAANTELQNVKGTQKPKWSIKGVIRSGVGKRSSAEVEFRKIFNLHD